MLEIMLYSMKNRFKPQFATSRRILPHLGALRRQNATKRRSWYGEHLMPMTRHSGTDGSSSYLGEVSI